MSLTRALHPLLIAAADLLVGGLLFQQVASVVGLVVAAVGLVMLCCICYRVLARAPTPRFGSSGSNS